MLNALKKIERAISLFVSALKSDCSAGLFNLRLEMTFKICPIVIASILKVLEQTGFHQTFFTAIFRMNESIEKNYRSPRVIDRVTSAHFCDQCFMALSN